ncbi:MAG: hypothetical protein GWO24_20900, partial [Akkermansiaceae bacterium]|nr:hypothetical protein [Akkermansiaceae bacterium]
QSYPDSKQASASRTRIGEIESRDIQRSYDIAEFYDRKGQSASALFYYREVINKTSGGELRDRAQSRLRELEAAGN